MERMITILGPTATGKTKFAAHLASLTGGEIISADSRQVYRGMDIGTGKDLDDYVVDGKRIRAHLIDVVEPGYVYNVFEFQQNFISAFSNITGRGLKPILCGGSGLYLDAVLRSYEMNKVHVNETLRRNLGELSDTELTEKLKTYGSLHNTTDTTDRTRTLRAIEIAEYQSQHAGINETLSNIRSVNFGIHYERQLIRNRITARLKSRLENGMIEEVRQLLQQGLSPAQLTFYGLEYKFVTLYVTGEISYDEMFGKLNTAIHQFAKRQMTWFRRLEKKGVKINWIEGNLPLEKKLKYVMERL